MAVGRLKVMNDLKRKDDIMSTKFPSREQNMKDPHLYKIMDMFREMC